MSTDRPRRRLDAGARREAILTAARAAFGAAPYDDVSVSAVAQDAGASESLVFHYYSGKAGLYAAALAAELDALVADQAATDAALPAGSSTRDRVRASLEVYFDHIERRRLGWAAPLLHGGHPVDQALEVLRATRADNVRRLATLLGVSSWPRHDYALRGYFAFVDGACLLWVERGCPASDRPALIDATLGALEGALGDWGT